MIDADRIREGCNAENNPDLPEGCMYPWCVCNRYPADREDAMREAHVILQSWILAWEDLAADELSQPLRAASDHEHECYLAAKAWCQKMGPVTPEEAAKYRAALSSSPVAQEKKP